MKITKKKPRPTFSQNIILRRASMGISAMKLAELAEIPYPTLRDIESGFSGGRPKTKELIAKALGTSVDELNTPLTQSRPAGGTTKSDLVLSIVELLPRLNENELGALLNLAEAALNRLGSDDSQSPKNLAHKQK